MDGAGMAHTAMARGLPMPRLTTEDSATDPTDTESALLMLRLTMDSDTAHTDMERGLPMPRPTTEDSDTAHTDMARGQPMPRPTTEDLATDLMVTARGLPMLTTDTADTAPTDTASKRFTTDGQAQPKLKIIAKRKSKSGTKPKLHPETKSD